MAYIDKYGVEFSDDGKTLVKCPTDLKGTYTVPQGVRVIRIGAFADCTLLESVELPSSIEYIGLNPLGTVPFEPESIFEPGGLWGMSGDAFNGCIRLQSINVSPDNPRFSSIDGVVYNKQKTGIELCPKGKQGSFSIPLGITHIYFHAFLNCKNISSICIPDSVISINDVFAGCQEIQAFIVAPDNPNYCSIEGVLYDKDRTTVIRCPEKKQGVVALADSVRIINDSAFKHCKELTSIGIPKGVENIEQSAFENCEKLNKISIPEGLRCIEPYTFSGCNNLESVSIPSNVNKIDSAAFKECGKLKELIIPDSVAEINKSAFEKCRSLRSILIPSSVTNIGDYAFYQCSNLITVILSIGVKNLGRGVFRDCKKLCTISIPNTITDIPDFAFSGCSNLTSITIPDGVKNIGIQAFENCEGLISAELPESLHSLGKWAFMGCCSLKSIAIPPHIQDIESRTFDGCTSLESVFIPDGVYNIKSMAFYECCNLTSVSLPYIWNLGNHAFANCTRLAMVTICGPNNMKFGEKIFENCPNLSTIIWNVRSATFDRDNTPFYAKKNYYREGYDIRDQITTFIFGEDVKQIPLYLCENMTNITSIVIPKNVEKIEERTFDGCSKLKEIIVAKGNRTFMSQDGVLFNKDTMTLEKYPMGKIETTYTIPNNVRIITYGAFDQCSKLTSLSFPNSVRDVWGDDAFMSCPITSVIVPIREEERFCKMEGLKPFADIIRQTSEKRIQQQQQRDEYEQRLLQEQQRQELFQDTILFFDTETTGLPPKGMYNASPARTDIWPRLVQIAWIVTNEDGKILKRRSEIIYPDGFTIPQEATDIHGITTERAKRDGKPLREVLDEFAKDLANAKQVVCHNVEFDQHIVGAELYRMNMDYDALMDKPSLCTMLSSTNFCAIPNPNGYDDYKWPKLSELYHKLFNKDFENAHDALADITATKDCFFELKRRGVIKE